MLVKEIYSTLLVNSVQIEVEKNARNPIKRIKVDFPVGIQESFFGKLNSFNIQHLVSDETARSRRRRRRRRHVPSVLKLYGGVLQQERMTFDERCPKEAVSGGHQQQ
jgi:hypothetical protein